MTTKRGFINASAESKLTGGLAWLATQVWLWPEHPDCTILRPTDMRTTGWTCVSALMYGATVFGTGLTYPNPIQTHCLGGAAKRQTWSVVAAAFLIQGRYTLAVGN